MFSFIQELTYAFSSFFFLSSKVSAPGSSSLHDQPTRPVTSKISGNSRRDVRRECFILVILRKTRTGRDLSGALRAHFRWPPGNYVKINKAAKPGTRAGQSFV